MLESIIPAAILEIGKEAVHAFLRGLQPSDFAKVGEQLLDKLLKKYERYGTIDESRLLLFFQRERIREELDAYREAYRTPNLEVIEAEFRDEFSTEFEASHLTTLASDFAQNFHETLISSLQAQIGLIIKRIEESDEKNSAHHAKTHQLQIRSEAKLDELLRLVRQSKKSTEEFEQLPKTQVDTSPEIERSSSTPYLRTIEYQERDLRQYKTAAEIFKVPKRGQKQVFDFRTLDGFDWPNRKAGGIIKLFRMRR